MTTFFSRFFFLFLFFSAAFTVHTSVFTTPPPGSREADEPFAPTDVPAVPEPTITWLSTVMSTIGRRSTVEALTVAKAEIDAGVDGLYDTYGLDKRIVRTVAYFLKNHCLNHSTVKKTIVCS